MLHNYLLKRTSKVPLFLYSLFIFCALFLPQFLISSDQNYGGNFSPIIQSVDQENALLYINKITFSCDIPLSEYEFFYTIGIKSNSFISKQDVDKACKQLYAKKRFSAVAVDVLDDQAGKSLHFSLTAHWIFKKLEFEGIWFGKPRYAALYLQQPGDIFDANLHDESLEVMKKYLHDQGFFNCIIADDIVYARKYKTLTVHIKVTKKDRFSVNKVSIVFSDLDQQKLVKSEDLSFLIKEVKSRIRSNVQGCYYSKKQFGKHLKKVRAFLRGLGYSNPRLSTVRRINPEKPSFDLVLNIQLGKRKIITLEGNTVFADEQIKKEFTSKNAPNWLFSPDIIAQQLLHEYYKKGYWHTQIKAQILKPFEYNFSIKEGLPAFIKAATVIDGTTHQPEKSESILNDLLKGKKCDQTILDESLERLKNSYQSNGFWDFKILEKRFDKNPTTGEYTVKIVIDKGSQHLWQGFTIDGFAKLADHEFFKKYKTFRVNQRVPFSLSWIQEQRAFLLAHLQQKGYWYAEVEPKLVFLEDKNLAATNSSPSTKVFLHWKIKRGHQVKFGKVIMRGATSIDFKRLQNQCAFKQNMLWDREKIDCTRKKLKRLDVFRTIQIQPYHLSKNKSKKPIIMTLIDDDPVELRVRAGYFFNSHNILFKQQSTPKIGSSFIIKNPSNRADRLAFVGDWTKFERKFCLDYQQPSPFGISAMGILRGYANKFVHPVEILHSGSAYQALQCGLLAGLNEQYKKDYHWGFNIGTEWLKITQVHGNLKLDKSLINRMLPYVFIEPSLEIDKLDNPVNTTSGSFSALSMRMMIPETKGEFIAKLLAEQSFFIPLYEKIIFASRVRFGHIFRRTFEKVLPVDRFYLGGPDSVRGYEPDALPPLGVSLRVVDGKIIKDYTIQGGSSMLNINLELRFPLYQSFGAVLFQDFGVLSQSGFAGFKSRWYPGSGFGFRYKTPIGAIRFDIGWKWKRRIKEDTRTYAWYLTLGEAF